MKAKAQVNSRKDTHSKEQPFRESSGTQGAISDRDIDAVVQIEQRDRDARSEIDQLSAKITRSAGTGTAILIHAAWFAVWLIVNLGGVPWIPAFDPFPFSFLTMIVSLEAIFLTLFVLVSQNRMSWEADKRAELDLQVNILAERESTMILRMLNEISRHLRLDGETRDELEELLKETKIDELAKKLESALPSE